MDASLIKSFKEIRTPLAFLSLALISTEGLLYALIDKVDGLNTTLLTIGMVLMPFVILLVFYQLFKQRPNGFEGGEIVDEESKKIKVEKFDLFVSMPMASFDSSKEYEKFRASILDAIRGIKRSCDFSKVFFAGDEISSFKDFESEDLSVVQDYKSLKNSDNFLLIYPKSTATSALIELGWAMVMKKPIIIFVKKKDDLPYLMKHADSVYKNIAVYTYNTSSDIQTKFSTNKTALFDALTSKSSRR